MPKILLSKNHYLFRLSREAMQYCLERGMYTFSRENDDNFDQDLEEAEKNQGENSSLYISKLYSQDKTKVLDVFYDMPLLCVL